MPSFECQVCHATFGVPQSALDKYPGWQPKYCRKHSPRRGATRRVAAPEENLTLAEVLAKYTEGPQSGVFTDGSTIPNPGPGGWGVVWVDDGEIRAQRHGHESGTTNNRMELTALIEGYRLIPEDAATTLWSDSKLCVQTINEWAPKWERKGWKKKGGPIKNLDLVQALLELHRSHQECSLEWTPGHSGSRWNEYADSLSTAWLREEL